MKIKFGFIGCGNMGGALASAAAKSLSPQEIAVCDAFPEKAADFAKEHGVMALDTKEIVKNAEFIFLGVKPQSFEGLFREIAPILKERTDRFVLVSMAAGISIEAVERLADLPCAVIRIMPNTPVGVGQGVILYSVNELVDERMLAVFGKGLSCAGVLDSIAQDKIDAASALSGCGPAFVAMFAEALADGAVACGLPRDKANLYAAQTLLGTARLILDSGKHPGQIKDAVCSPGGTTIAGVAALENGAFRFAVSNAVTAAYERTLELKK